MAQKLWLPLCLLAFSGCNPGENPPPPGIDRGPTVLDIDADPNGLFWDDASQTLLIADDNGNRVLQFTDDASFALVADLPAAPANGAGLGQLVKTADGTIVVTRFGFGTSGDIVFINPDSTTGVVPNLDVTRRRIGLTVSSDGTLFDAFFVVNAGVKVGTVAVLTLDGTETEVIGGLQKPVGVLAVGDQLFVSDQDQGQVFQSSIANPGVLTAFSVLDSPDLLAEGPAGTLFTGSRTGDVIQIGADGATSILAGGFQETRGIAFDPTNNRIFVSDHDGNEADGVTHHLLILPVDP